MSRQMVHRYGSYAIGFGIIAVLVWGFSDPQPINPAASLAVRPYFDQAQSFFARGNFIDLDSTPDAAPVDESALAFGPPNQLWTVAGTNTVSLNWTRQPDTQEYVVRYRPTAQTAVLTAEVSAPFFTVRNARAGQTYEFSVASVDEDGRTGSFSPTTAVTPTALTSSTRVEQQPFEVSAWLPPGWENKNVQASFERGVGTLTEINPFWYNFSSAGALEAKGSARNPEVIARAHQSGMRVVFTITNNFDTERVTRLLASPDKQQKLIQDILAELSLYDYDGVDLDFEDVSPADKDGFSEFVIKLAKAVHDKQKIIELTGQAKKSDGDNWNGPGSLDLARLSSHVDVFRPMLYDHARPNTDPGPLAPLAWISEVLTYWKSKVPAGKIQAALPLYGYDWSLSTDDDIGIQWQDGQHILDKYAAEESRDTASGEVHLTYADEDGPREVYYQDAQSVQQKVAAVRAAGVESVAFWLLGGEDPATFGSIRALTSSTTVTVQKPLNIGLKLKGSQVAVSVSKFPEVDHVSIFYGNAPDLLSQKLDKQTASIINLPDLQPGEQRFIQAVAYDNQGHEIRKSGIAYVRQ